MPAPEVYLRRVRNPEPMLVALAAQAVDDYFASKTSRSIVLQAQAFGVPLGYVLDELERRVRAGEGATR